MAISEIDVMQTGQIEGLQEDVEELRAKLNLIVTDITHGTNGLTKKLNDAIEDAEDLNTVINAGYSVGSGGGTSNTGILKRLDELINNFINHQAELTENHPFQPSSLAYRETHPVTSNTQSLAVYGSPANPGCELSGTAQGSATRSQHVSVAQAVTSGAPVYITGTKASVVTVGRAGVVRSKRMSRNLLKQTR